MLNEGVSGESSVEMAARFSRDTIYLHPDLVIWQTGSNDILNGTEPAQFEAATRDGVRRLHAAGIDVMIMEPQFSPRIVANPNYGAYMNVLDKIARMRACRSSTGSRQWNIGSIAALSAVLRCCRAMRCI